MIHSVIVPAKVLPPKSLARFLERHRLLDETSGTAPERFLLTLVRRSLDFVPAQASLLLLDDPIAKEDDRSKNPLTVVVAAGIAGEAFLGKRVRPVEGLAGFVYARGERTSVNDIRGANALSRELDPLLPNPVAQALAVPIVIESHVCGSLILINEKTGNGFDARDERVMELFGDTLSLALQNLLDERRAREVARRDSLTSLYNDRYFHKKLLQEIVKLQAQPGGDLALLFLDCDHLKSVNDEHGHLAGSQVLRELAYILQRNVADVPCLPCRYGGDEFTIILQDTGLPGALGVAERIRKAVEEWTFLPMSIGPGEPGLNLKGIITISIGVSTFRLHCGPERPPNEQKNQLLKQADAALYMAKLAGKNCVVAAPEAPLGTISATVILKS
jgi:diguanylate cyclase (GGDEF)-like protein